MDGRSGMERPRWRQAGSTAARAALALLSSSCACARSARLRLSVGGLLHSAKELQPSDRQAQEFRSLALGILAPVADPAVLLAQQWLCDHEQELLADTIRMLQVPSVEAEPAPNAPFGAELRDALDLALQYGEAAGMRITDLAGYAGYAEFGAGVRLVVALGHLDVVPVGRGWKHDPFGAEIDGGYIYARGSVDDKGPTMAAFYAARALLETCPELPSRVRVVFGCNEESGMQCVARYAKTEEAPTYGVAPDSAWPLVHGEKGIANLVVSVAIPDGNLRMIDAEGGERPNIVPDRCKIRVAVAPSLRGELEEKLGRYWDRNVTWQWHSDGTLLAESEGKAAHGSTPHSGDSAATRLFRLLVELAPAEERKFYQSLLDMAHIGGVGLGISGSDEPSGDLTCNLGVV
jgi:succinyl-diaminopimelate desuccinylase